MPWSVSNLPPSVEKMNLTDKEKEQFVAVANSVLKETGDEGRAIASGLSAIQKSKKGLDGMRREIKQINFEIKAFNDEEGTFEGYASIFGNKDAYNEIVRKGAFIESLSKRKPKLLWQHKISEPIGIYDEVREDESGLFVKGRLAIKTELGRRAYELLKMGAIDGLSIGYSVSKDGDEYDKSGSIRYLKKVELYEVSIVTIPANDKSLVNSIKSTKEIEQFECMKDFENFLKEPRSLNSQERKTFISKLKEFSNKRDVEEEEAKKRDAEAKETTVNSLEELKKSVKLAELYLLTKK